MQQQAVAHRLHPSLRPFVAAAVGYRHAGFPPGEHTGLPSPHLTLVFTLDGPLVVTAHPDPRQPPGRFETLVGGLHTRPARMRHPGHQEGIQLSLTPLGARALLRVPAGELASTDLPLEDVLGAAGRELHERTREAHGWAARFAAVERLLRREIREDGHPQAEVAEAWRLTNATGGRLPVREVARRTGWSLRHLETRFRAETGLSPKEAARVVRFDGARRALAARVATGGAPDLASLAAAAGFADQAHLTREWRAFAGLPPSRWLAAEFAFVQDTHTLTAALSAS